MNEYRIHRSTSLGFTPGPANFINSTIHPLNFYLDINLTDGTTYYYKVLAVDDDNNYEPAIIQRSGIPQDTVPPSQPQNFTITNINGSLLLNWSQATENDFVKYEVWRNGSWINVGTYTDRTHNWHFDPSDQLLDTFSYLYELRVYDEVGYDTFSAPLQTNLTSPSGDVTPPSNVTDLTANQLGSGGYVRLAWGALPDLDVLYYKIYRSNQTGFIPDSSTLIANTTTPNYDDYDPELNGTGVLYYYIVRGVDEGDNEATGGVQANVVVLDTEQPIAVLTFRVLAQTDGSIKLVWTANTPADFYSYNIYRVVTYKPAFIPHSTNLLVKIYNNNTFDYIDPQYNLLDDTAYTYKIAIADEVGDSTYKGGFNSTIGDFTPPSAPTGLNVTNEGTGSILDISWNANPELDVASYNIYRNSTVDAWTFVDSSTTNSYQDTGLVEYRNYFYYIAAVDENDNEGSPSTIVNNHPNDTKAPDAPTWSTVVYLVLGRDVILVFENPPDADVVYFNVYRGNQMGGPYAWIGNNTVSGYADQDLAIGTYYYVVTAVDEKEQESVYSVEINVTIALYPPYWEIALISDNGNGDITLWWSDNASNLPAEDSLIGYSIFRKNVSRPFADWLADPIASAAIGFVAHIDSIYMYQFTDYGVPNGNWTYFVTTLDDLGGESKYSTSHNLTVTDVMAPGAPWGVDVSHILVPGAPNMTVSWQAPNITDYGFDVAFYEIYISTDPITNITGWIANVTVFGRLTLSYSFYNFTDDTYYFIVIAYDENNYSSSLSNTDQYTVDTTTPIIIADSITDPSLVTIGAGVDVPINISVRDAGGIANVYLTYTVDGGTPEIVQMLLSDTLPDGTEIWSGTISGKTAGAHVNFTITVVDNYGHQTESATYSYLVVGEEPPWTMIIVLVGVVAIGAISAAVVISRSRAKGKKKEYIAEELLPLPI
jgi:fibronectin type 3 domain-containing protein